MSDCWSLLLHHDYANKNYDDESKTFAIKTYKNDYNYLKANYYRITNTIIQYECFIIACTFSNNINILELFVDKFRVDPNYINKYQNNCLLLACSYNHNLSIIQYLIETLKVNIYYIKNIYSCFELACMHNTFEIVKYLIEKTDVKISCLMQTEWLQLVPIIKTNYIRFNELIAYGLSHYFETNVI